MGIAAYNRGSRAISDHISQQLRENRQADLQRESKPGRMWTPPKGWFKAAIQARLDRENMQARIEDNQRRADFGLPTYEV